jgi:hypothetical protein
VNLGGEPERDDFGLPPVDIEIPDDARELDRDVQAYRRELRAQRRHARAVRLHAPFTRDGVVLPLLASCLVLALIAGTLLTVFTAGPSDNLVGSGPANPKQHASSGPATAASSTAASGAKASATDSPNAVLSSQKLPDQPILAHGTPVSLTSLLAQHGSLVLALVPARCDCLGAVQRLVSQAGQAGLSIYLVGALHQFALVEHLARGLPGNAIPAEDLSGALYRDYQPRGLTALLVHQGGTVAVAGLSGLTFYLTNQLSLLKPEASGAASSSGPAQSTPSATPPSGGSSPAPRSSPAAASTGK